MLLVLKKTDLEAPHTRRVVEGRVQLPRFAEVLNIPNVKAMVVVDT